MSTGSTDRTAWLDAPQVAAGAFGWHVWATDSWVRWTELATGARWTALRSPGTQPWTPRCPRITPSGGWIDLGTLVLSRDQVLSVQPGRHRYLGHCPVERRVGRTEALVGTLPPLPEAALELGARPWPSPDGWAWADGNVLYRMAPTGTVAVAGCAPGPISAWDIGPWGAVWFVAAGCLWLAGPGQYARRCLPDIESAIGVPLEHLEPGALIFSDDGQTVAAVEVDAAHAVHLNGRPTVGRHLGNIVALSPEPQPFPPVAATAIACLAKRHVVRVTSDAVSWFGGAGLVRRMALNLTRTPDAIGESPDGTITMLVGRTLLGVHPRRGPAQGDARYLAQEWREPQIVDTEDGAVWVAPRGSVLPLNGIRRSSLAPIIRVHASPGAATPP